LNFDSPAAAAEPSKTRTNSSVCIPRRVVYIEEKINCETINIDFEADADADADTWQNLLRPHGSKLRNQKRVSRYLAQFSQPKSSIRHMATANMHLSEL